MQQPLLTLRLLLARRVPTLIRPVQVAALDQAVAAQVARVGLSQVEDRNEDFQENGGRPLLCFFMFKKGKTVVWPIFYINSLTG